MSETDPMSAVAGRAAAFAGESAKNMAARELRSQLKRYVPRVLWPLIPGERGSVEANVKAGMSRWFWGAVTSAIISLMFFAAFGVAIVGFVAVTGFAVVTSM